MALYSKTKINGVTKEETETGFRYDFPLVKIETFTAGDYMVIQSRTDSKRDMIWFNDLENNLDATSIASYVDALALAGFYQASTTGASAIDSANADSDSYTRAVLNDIAHKLEIIIHVLSKIAE